MTPAKTNAAPRSASTPLPAVSGEELHRRATAIGEALDHAGTTIPARAVEPARALQGKVSERTSIAGARTVAALAGATGSGKSSLFNYLVGEPVSRIGARRPTTSSATAAIWGQEPSAELLDWLGVDSRHQTAESLPQHDALDGLVLLDLPDFDSRVVEHRMEADRLLRLVDVFVWVTDPQKYADAILHDDYVRTMAAHAGVTLAVLNQVDRLAPQDVDACVADLKQLFARDGLTEVKVIATSTVSHVGLDNLGGALASVVQSHNAASHRLLGDLRSQAGDLRAYVGDSEPEIPKDTGNNLVLALENAAGVPIVLDAVERDYRRHAVEATGWPFLRWTTRLRPKPLRQLGLQDIMRDDDLKGMSRSQARAATGRSSLPAASTAARSAVEVATRRLGEQAAQGLPPQWSEQVADAATPDDRSMVDALDQAVMRTSVSSKRPMWWSIFSVLQWLFAAMTVVGIGWFAAIVVLGWVQLEVPAPKLGAVPWPLFLLVVGIAGGLLFAAIARALAARAARRRRKATAKDLRREISQVASSHVLKPVRTVLDRHEAVRKSLDAAAN